MVVRFLFSVQVFEYYTDIVSTTRWIPKNKNVYLYNEEFENSLLWGILFYIWIHKHFNFGDEIEVFNGKEIYWLTGFGQVLNRT